MLDSLLRILALTRKELLAVLKDKRSRNSLLLPVFVQTLIFGYAATYDLNHVPYAVLDQDRSAASAQLIAKFDGARAFQRVATLTNTDQIRPTIDNKRALMVLTIPPDFGRLLGLGQAANVQVIADGRNSNTAGTATGYASEVIDGFNADWRSDHNIPGPSVTIEQRSWYNPNLETRWNMIPGMIGQLTLLQVMLLAAMSGLASANRARSISCS
jgi:ABC-2 type transport system permease protein